MKETVPIWEKLLLTINEASDYSGIGKNKIYELCNMPLCDFVVYNGTKKMIKREEFKRYISSNRVI